MNAIELGLGRHGVLGGVIGGHQITAKSALELVGVGGAVGQRGIDGVDLGGRERACQAIVLADHLVRNRHGLTEHIGRRIGEADVVAVGLGHLAGAIGALEQRHGERDLRLHAHLLHELAAGKEVEELVAAAHLDVGLDLDRVVRLHDGVQELVQRDGRLGLIALGKVIALENAGDGELGGDREELLEVHGEHPVTVVDDGRLLGVEDLHGLGDVSRGVGLDLLLGELRARGVLAGRVADGGGAVADNEGHAVAEVLELAHLAQRDGMAEVKVRARGVDAQLDVERHAALELLLEVGLGHDLGSARGDDAHLLVYGQHEMHLSWRVIAPSPRPRPDGANGRC